MILSQHLSKKGAFSAMKRVAELNFMEFQDDLSWRTTFSPGFEIRVLQAGAWWEVRLFVK